MAIGPLARLLAQLVVPVVAVLARALPAAYAQALQNARKSGMDAAPSAASILRKTLTKQEALQILNLEESTATAEAIQKVRCCCCYSSTLFTSTNYGSRLTIWYTILYSNTKNTWPPMM